MKHIFPLILILLTGLFSCNSPKETAIEKAISVSVLPQKYFAEAIAGSTIKVNVMIPPGASHSSYEPTARQMNLLTNSQAYLKIGHLDFELAWMPRFVGINTEMKIFDLSEGIDLITGKSHQYHESENLHSNEDTEGVDPHIWMSPANVKKIAFNILNSLTSVYPADSSVFLTNYNAFIIQVDSVLALFNAQAEMLKGKSFIIYHPALAYLARDYGMEQIVLEFEGKEPPPAHIKSIIDLAKEKNIKYIFVQKQFSIDNSRSLANEINAEIIPINPVDEDWKGQMIEILKHLSEKAE
jgi:zinc transport system substrate-binding protein